MFKRKRISFDQAIKAMDYYSLIPLRFLEVDIAETLEIAYNYSVYAYGAYFIGCARKTNSPLITLDDSLKATAMAIGINVIEV